MSRGTFPILVGHRFPCQDHYVAVSQSPSCVRHACPATVTPMTVGTFNRQHRVSRVRRSDRPRGIVTQRVIAPIGRGTHVPYPDGVPAEIDGEAWAQVVNRLIAANGGNKTTFAAAIGVDRKTVTRWSLGRGSVSEDSVRRVARAVGVPPAELLLAVGLYEVGELTSPSADIAIADEDRAITEVRKSDLPLPDKKRIIEMLERRREEHERQRVAEAELLMQLVQPKRARRDVG